MILGRTNMQKDTPDTVLLLRTEIIRWCDPRGLTSARLRLIIFFGLELLDRLPLQPRKSESGYAAIWPSVCN